MDLNISRSRWRKRSQRSKPLLLLFIFVAIAFLLFASSTSKPFKPVLPFSQTPQCAVESPDLSGKRFLWYAPHSGFSNQLSEFKNAILIAGILNRTLIVPPVLDHHAVALGSCPKFRVVSPSELRAKVWDHIMELIRDRRFDLFSICSAFALIVLLFLCLMLVWLKMRIWSRSVVWIGCNVWIVRK